MSVEDVRKGTCDYCGRENVYICSTPEVTERCIECHQLVIANCREAVRSIRAISKKKSSRSKEKDLAELEASAKAAIGDLMHFDMS